MSTNVLTIPKKFGISVQNYIIDTFRDKYPAGLIPVDPDHDGEPYSVRIPYMSDFDVSKNGLDWDPNQALAEAQLNYTDCSLFVQQVKLGFKSRDFRQSSPIERNAKQKAIIEKFLREIQHDIFHGRTQDKVTLASGLRTLANSGSVTEDLDGADSVLADAASLLAGLKKMVTTIPAKYRDGNIVIMIIDHTLAETCATTFIGDSSVSVLTAFKNAFPYVHIERNNAAVLISGTDTEGTHSRILTFVQHVDILRIVKPKEVSPVGPALIDLTGGIQQLWGTLYGLKVLQPTAVLYSEQITYS